MKKYVNWKGFQRKKQNTRPYKVRRTTKLKGEYESDRNMAVRKT
jgi:hypothetical protein